MSSYEVGGDAEVYLVKGAYEYWHYGHEEEHDEVCWCDTGLGMCLPLSSDDSLVV